MAIHDISMELAKVRGAARSAPQTRALAHGGRGGGTRGLRARTVRVRAPALCAGCRRRLTARAPAARCAHRTRLSTLRRRRRCAHQPQPRRCARRARRRAHSPLTRSLASPQRDGHPRPPGEGHIQRRACRGGEDAGRARCARARGARARHCGAPRQAPAGGPRGAARPLRHRHQDAHYGRQRRAWPPRRARAWPAPADGAEPQAAGAVESAAAAAAAPARGRVCHAAPLSLPSLFPPLLLSPSYI